MQCHLHVDHYELTTPKSTQNPSLNYSSPLRPTHGISNYIVSILSDVHEHAANEIQQRSNWESAWAPEPTAGITYERVPKIGDTVNHQDDLDPKTCHTMQQQDEYIQLLVVQVRQDISSHERVLMKPHFPDVLEEFALRLGNEDENTVFLEMMQAFHQMRAYVLPYLNTLQNSREANTILSRNITDQICLVKSPSEISSHIERDQLLFKSISFKIQFEPHRKKLQNSRAYSWLLSTVRQTLQMNGDVAQVMKSQKARMLQMLRENTPSTYRQISRDRKPNQYTIRFKLDWNMLIFMKHQEYSDDDSARGIVRQIITLTGHQGTVYATPLGDYMTTVWPSTGIDIVEFFEDFWENNQRPLES